MRLEPHEAIALARQLLAHPCGMPALENIQLGADGSASCIAADGVPSVMSVADLLLTLLPHGTPNVPAPLRLAIARGLETVEAPPFASLEEFSNTLARFEKGASRDVLRSVLQRSGLRARPIAARIPGAPTPMTARTPGPSPAGAQPIAMPARPTLAVDNTTARSSPLPQPIAGAPSIFRPFGSGEEAGAPGHAWRGWALTAAAVFVASFTVGFGVMDGITARRAAGRPPTAPATSPGSSPAAPVANDSAANSAHVELKTEIVRVPATAAVAPGLAPPRGAARTTPPAGMPSGSAGYLDGEAAAIRAVHATTADAFSPAFASDGSAIFFHTGRERDARSAIEAATAGSETGGDLAIMTIVDDGAHNYHAQPSPDGRFVAFDSDRDGVRGVYVANRDGSHVRRLSGAGYAAVPTWSRDSEWLAYVRQEADKPSVWNLWMQPATGGPARRLTNHRYGQTWAASWFPDNRRIAYSHEDALVVMDVQTGETTRYRTPIRGQLVRTPAVSPDGAKIIFQVFRHGAWMLDLADGSAVRVLEDPTAEEFAWAPDGRRVAFHSRRDGHWRIYVLSPR